MVKLIVIALSLMMVTLIVIILRNRRRNAAFFEAAESEPEILEIPAVVKVASQPQPAAVPAHTWRAGVDGEISYPNAVLRLTYEVLALGGGGNISARFKLGERELSFVEFMDEAVLAQRDAVAMCIDDPKAPLPDLPGLKTMAGSHLVEELNQRLLKEGANPTSYILSVVLISAGWNEKGTRRTSLMTTDEILARIAATEPQPVIQVRPGHVPTRRGVVIK